MKKLFTITLAAVALTLACAALTPAHAQSFLDRIGKALDKVDETMKKVDNALGTGSSDNSNRAQEPQQTAPVVEDGITAQAPGNTMPATAPAATAADNLITASGAGPFRFGGAMKTGQVGGYTVTKVYHEFEDVDVYYIKDAADNFAIIYYTDWKMQIDSSAFQLENGIKVGMTLAEVKNIMGAGWAPDIDEGLVGDSYLSIWITENIGLVGMELTEAANAAHENAYLKGTALEFTLNDFVATSNITSIMIR